MAVNKIKFPDNTSQDIHDYRITGITQIGIDTTPTANSDNFVTSDGIKNYVDNSIPSVPVQDVTLGGSSVVSSGIAVLPAYPTVPVTDVTVGGTSVVSSGTAAVPDIPSVLDDLSDVDTGTLTGGEVLVYDDTQSKWTAGTAPSGGGDSKIYVGTCSTAAATANKVVTVETFPLDSNDLPLVGTTIAVKFSNSNSASSPKLNVNSTGNQSIYYDTGAYTSSSTFAGSAGRYNFYVWDGSYWVFLSWGYDLNTLAYNIRTNSYSLVLDGRTYRYRLLFTSADNTKWVPANTSTSTNATASRTTNQTPINPLGRIVYYASTTSVADAGTPSSTVLYEQYNMTLGYSFNRTGAALTLTTKAPVYIKCAPQSDGSAIIDADTPYTQALPSTEDGKIYILLGYATSATQVEMLINKPVYWYKNGAIRQWTNDYTPDSPPEIFWATYNTTTFADVKAAYEAGKEVLVKYTENGSDIVYSVTGTAVNQGEITYLMFAGIGGQGVLVLTVSSTGWAMTNTAIEVQGNKVTSLSSSSTDTQYPSAKCVYDALAALPTDAVLYSQQSLTDAQKKQARLNQGLYYPEQVAATSITWDGDITGKENFSVGGIEFYKVASSPVDVPIYALGTATGYWDGTTENITLTWSINTNDFLVGEATWGYAGDYYVAITRNASTEDGSVSDGIYFSYSDFPVYVSSLSISSYIHSDNTIPTACLEDVTGEIKSTSTETEIASGKAVYNAVHPKLKDGGSYIDPNVLYDYGYMEEGIVLYLNTPSDNTIENEYKLCFRQGSIISSLTWPAGITWIGNCLNSNGVPVMHANCYYEVSIMNSCGIIVEWKL